MCNPFDPSRFDLAQRQRRAARRRRRARGDAHPDARPRALARGGAGDAPAGLIPGMPAPPPPQRQPEVRTIQGPAGRLALRCFQPASGRPRATMLHIHGGGWFTGSADMMDVALERRADALERRDRERRVPARARASVPGRARRLRGGGRLAGQERAQPSSAPTSRSSAASRRAATSRPSPRCACATATASASPARISSTASTTSAACRATRSSTAATCCSTARACDVAIRMFVPDESLLARPRRLAALREPLGAVPRALHGRHARPAARPHALHVRGVARAGQPGGDPDLPGRAARLRHVRLPRAGPGARARSTPSSRAVSTQRGCARADRRGSSGARADVCWRAEGPGWRARRIATTSVSLAAPAARSGCPPRRSARAAARRCGPSAAPAGARSRATTRFCPWCGHHIAAARRLAELASAGARRPRRDSRRRAAHRDRALLRSRGLHGADRGGSIRKRSRA